MVEPIKELRVICQGERRLKETTWLIRNYCRRVSIYITKALLYTPITANQVTLSMTALGVIAGVLLAFGNYWLSIVAALLMHLMAILDSVDGEIARYRMQSSKLGEFYDHFSHHITQPAIFIGMSLGVYNTSHDVRALFLGFLGVIAILWSRLVTLEGSHILAQAGKDERNSEEPSTVKRGKVMRLLLAFNPTSMDFVMFVVLLGAIFNYLYLVLFSYAVLFFARFIAQLVYYLRRGFD